MLRSSPPTSAPERLPSPFSPEYLWITIGSCALVFLSAFESLAVTTIMPVVSAELNGAHLYALAFAGPLATSVMGMVFAGNWSDRRGPTVPLYTASVFFALGLIIAGTANTMEVLVAGRLVQGLGSGAVIVSLYVVVARVYPPRLHPSIFAGFAAAWVIPSLIGPLAAGAIAEMFTWHWVFLSVVGLVFIALLMVNPALRSLPIREADTSVKWAYGRIAWSALAALAVLSLAVLFELKNVGDVLPGVLAGAAAIVAIIAARPLLPRGTLRARRGLPSVILLRGVAAAAFFGAEVYVPYMLVDEYKFTPSLAGLALTVGALSWAGASWLQGRLSHILTNPMSTVIGSSLTLVAILSAFATALFTLPPAVVIIGWVIGGGGMGLMYPRIATMTLAMSTPTNQGFNSSSLSISDAMGASLALATTGIVVSLLGASGMSFAGVFAFTAIIGVFAIVIAPRVVAPGAVAASTAAASTAVPGVVTPCVIDPETA